MRRSSDRKTCKFEPCENYPKGNNSFCSPECKTSHQILQFAIKPSRAEYMRSYRRMKKKNNPKSINVPPTLEQIESDNFKRGRILTEMMRTPPCLWKVEWLEDA